ncbi:hypothetical protein [Leptospira mayottensis]|uniref:hypothetical protein n=1 Tax=Leptospira mayottensis TaxID=1137606 RepID=UPI0020B159A9|nr:hypothetical protein [Leptospira mayottensis]
MANIRTLGIHATTGQPVSGDQMLPSEMNVVEAFGRFPRIFDNVIELNGEIDRDYIIGTAQQENSLGMFWMMQFAKHNLTQFCLN